MKNLILTIVVSLASTFVMAFTLAARNEVAVDNRIRTREALGLIRIYPRNKSFKNGASSQNSYYFPT